MKITKQAMDHLKSHVEYPISKADLIATCNNWSDSTPADLKAAKSLPDKTFNNVNEVMKALSM